VRQVLHHARVNFYHLIIKSYN